MPFSLSTAGILVPSIQNESYLRLLPRKRILSPVGFFPSSSPTIMMFTASRILSTALLIAVVSANPVVVRDNLIRLPFAKHFNSASGALNILEADQAHAAALRAHGQAKAAGALSKDAVFSAPLTNHATYYSASIGVGTPPTNCELFELTW